MSARKAARSSAVLPVLGAVAPSRRHRRAAAHSEIRELAPAHAAHAAQVADMASADPLLAAIGDEWRLLGQAWERAGIAGTFPGDLADRPAVLVDAIALLE